MNIASDQDTREQALDISQSFIVQAPAGSGKTALLTQRILALLAVVNDPEECLAITFTRKAAAEMRERILQALHDAHQKTPTPSRYAEHTRALALAVLARDRARNWNLLANPNRLKIQTIDSLNVSLTSRMPILSGFGAQPEILTSADDLYTIAAHAVLTEAVVDADHLPYLHTIFQHLDNDRELTKKLFVSLLPLREQWLPYIMHTYSIDEAKTVLEHGLQTAVLDYLLQLAASIPPLPSLPQLAASAAGFLSAADGESAISNCRHLTAWPGQDLAALPAWHGIAELVLNKAGAIRKTVTKAQGFPAPNSGADKLHKAALTAHKQAMLEVLTSLDAYPVFVENLRLLSYLPPLAYSADSWQFMAALVKILPLLVAQLTVTFREHGQIDLPEVAMAARMALGAFDAPSDLALALDYKISHILVDEFQDTSIAQFGLLEHLVAGWTAGDGKTLFLVGDPMQSIYRFRQAEVGLFVTAAREGIAEVMLQPLYLTANFRSTPAVMAWVNTAFAEIFPQQNNPILGEVAYAPSTATREEQLGGVEFVCYTNADLAFEAAAVVATIQRQQAADPAATIAILVRSRRHLRKILPALKQAQIAYQGIEIEPLTEKPIILDLLALTKALLHLSDTIAWLAILRAPWCGLTLADLTVLLADNHDNCVWHRVQSFVQIEGLSLDGKQRLQAFRLVFTEAIALADRMPLFELVLATWRALRGPECAPDSQSLDDADVFFALLRQHTNSSQMFAIDFWEQQLTRLFSKPKITSKAAVQIMTIHKAKGLEFDTVILPGLANRARADQARLFRWQERTSIAGDKHLIFAPIKAVGEAEDQIYQFLQYTEQQRNHYELARLVYVAATRARNQLFGFATLADAGSAVSGSMLELIADFVPQVAGSLLTATASHEQYSQTLQRLPLAELGTALALQAVIAAPEGDAAVDKAPQDRPQSPLLLPDLLMRQVGIVVHKIFYQIASLGLQQWQQLPGATVAHWQLMLQAAGVANAAMPEGLELVTAAVERTLLDANGRWLFASQHSSAKAEWELTAFINGQVKQVIIDRTFLAADGARWIIDYKIVHGSKATIVPAYKQQLRLYKQILQLRQPQECITTAIYFPLQARLEVVTV